MGGRWRGWGWSACRRQLARSRGEGGEGVRLGPSLGCGYRRRAVGAAAVRCRRCWGRCCLGFHRECPLSLDAFCLSAAAALKGGGRRVGLGRPCSVRRGSGVVGRRDELIGRGRLGQLQRGGGGMGGVDGGTTAVRLLPPLVFPCYAAPPGRHPTSAVHLTVARPANRPLFSPPCEQLLPLSAPPLPYCPAHVDTFVMYIRHCPDMANSSLPSCAGLSQLHKSSNVK